MLHSIYTPLYICPTNWAECIPAFKQIKCNISDSKFETKFEKLKSCPKIDCFLKNHPTSYICLVQYLRNQKLDSKS